MKALTPLSWICVVVSLALVVMLAWWIVTEPGRAREKAAEARAGQVVAEGQVKAGADAIGIADDARTTDQTNEALSRETADVIRNAPGAAQPLDPGLNRTARQRLCLKAAYRDTPECLQLADRP